MGLGIECFNAAIKESASHASIPARAFHTYLVCKL